MDIIRIITLVDADVIYSNFKEKCLNVSLQQAIFRGRTGGYLRPELTALLV